MSKVSKLGRCWPWTHSWSKWRGIGQGTIISRFTDRMLGQYEELRRECSECGKVQMREVRT